MNFLESIGFWEEAKQLGISAKENKKHGRRTVKHAAEGSNPGRFGGSGQHYLFRAIKCVVEAENASKLAEQMRLSPTTADEQAVQSLVAASRTFVPALRALRNAATD